MELKSVIEEYKEASETCLKEANKELLATMKKSFPDNYEVVELLFTTTQDWGRSVGIIKVDEGEKKKFSRKATRISSYLNKAAHLGDQNKKQDLLGLVSLILEEELPPIAIKSGQITNFPYGVVIVPTANSNSHNYSLGDTIISMGRGETFVSVSGRSGNHMDRRKESFRLATLDEIVKMTLKITNVLVGEIKRALGS